MIEAPLSPTAAILAIALYSALFGWVLMRSFAVRRIADPIKSLEFLLAATGLGVLVTGWLALVLAELSIFSLSNLLLSTAIIAIASTIFGRRLRQTGAAASQPEPSEGSNDGRFLLPTWLEFTLLALWLAASLWLNFRPHEMIRGGSDAGVYVSLGASVAREGSLALEDEVVASILPELRDVLLRPLSDRHTDSLAADYYLFPGLYVVDAAEGKLVPQFYHLHPSWLAVAYSLGGLKASLALNGLWTTLAGLAFYLAARRLMSNSIAMLALAALSISALQVWFARYPTSEPLTQLLFWLALWAFVSWIQSGRKSRLWALLSSLALGSLMLVRIDSIFVLLLPATLLIWQVRSANLSRRDWLFYIPVTLLALHSVGHALALSRPYFLNIFGWVIVSSTDQPLELVAGAAAVVLAVIVGYAALRKRTLLQYTDQIRLIAAVTTGLIGLYAWLVWPNVSGGATYYTSWFSGSETPLNLDSQNLLRLGWYISHLGILTGIAGASLAVWRLKLSTSGILLLGITFSLLYISNNRARPAQIYAMRRLVPMVLPFFVFSAGYLFSTLLSSSKRFLQAAATVLALLWLGGFAWGARGFISQTDFVGIGDDFAQVAAVLPENAVLLFDDQSPVGQGDIFGTPLRLIYGIDAISLRDREGLDPATLRQQIDVWQDIGRQVYWVGEPVLATELGFTVGSTDIHTFSGSALESSYDRKPTVVKEYQWQLEISALN